MTTLELIQKARDLMDACPRGANIDLRGVPFRDLPPDWTRTVTTDGTVMCWSQIENEHGVHVGELTMHSEERATREGTWLLPDGTPFTE